MVHVYFSLVASEYHPSLNPGCSKFLVPVVMCRILLGFQMIDPRLGRLSPYPFLIGLILLSEWSYFKMEETSY